MIVEQFGAFLETMDDEKSLYYVMVAEDEGILGHAGYLYNEELSIEYISRQAGAVCRTERILECKQEL